MGPIRRYVLRKMEVKKIVRVPLEVLVQRIQECSRVWEIRDSKEGLEVEY